MVIVEVKFGHERAQIEAPPGRSCALDPALRGRKDVVDALWQIEPVWSWDRDPVTGAAHLGGRLEGNALHRQDTETRRHLPREPAVNFRGLDGFVEFQFQHFLQADNAEAKGLGEHQARHGMEALGEVYRQLSAAQSALEALYHVAVTDETQVAALAKADADLVAGARSSALRSLRAVVRGVQGHVTLVPMRVGMPLDGEQACAQGAASRRSSYRV
jgi:hypothetical protein